MSNTTEHWTEKHKNNLAAFIEDARAHRKKDGGVCVVLPMARGENGNKVGISWIEDGKMRHLNLGENVQQLLLQLDNTTAAFLIRHLHRSIAMDPQEEAEAMQSFLWPMSRTCPLCDRDKNDIAPASDPT